MSATLASRRNLLRAGATLGGAVILPLAACGDKGKAKDVSAVEDLMREHGVLRRALLVYEETAAKLAAGGASLDAAALNRTAKLFRAFGEDYHERKLEETYIFPRVKQAGGAAAAYVDVLLAQHKRGREITDYIMGQTAQGKQGGDTAPFARALQTFVLMYQNHTAREDTIVFPAWKAAISDHELDEMGDKFEDIETQQFGDDGFDKAVQQMDDIERDLGFTALSQFTAPSPPAS
jgi:hemerythrin-like domain-containing protein